MHSTGIASQLQPSKRSCWAGKPLTSLRVQLPVAQAFSSSFQGYSNFQQRASRWVTEQRLEQKAEEAGKAAESTLRNTYERAQASARRTYSRLDSEYNLSDKASTAGRRVEEKLREVDQQWNVRRKIRGMVEYVQRGRPRWQAAASEFLSTPVGKAFAVVLLLVLLQSPLFWRAMNFVLLLW